MARLPVVRRPLKPTNLWASAEIAEQEVRLLVVEVAGKKVPARWVGVKSEESMASLRVGVAVDDDSLLGQESELHHLAPAAAAAAAAAGMTAADAVVVGVAVDTAAGVGAKDLCRQVSGDRRQVD